MAERNPPLFMDVADVYSGDELALPYRDIISEGIVGAGSLEVTAGAGNTIDVDAGAAWVLGDSDPTFQPNYRVINDAVVNKGINPDPANPLKVLVVAQVRDAGFSGATREWEIVPIHGTPAASPALPALPDSALPLAEILVPAAAGSSAAYTITDSRVRAVVGGGEAPMGAWQDWTPTKITQDASDVTNVAHSVVHGRYVKIGNTVHIALRVDFTAAGSSGQPITLQGLPLTPANPEAVGGIFAYDAGTKHVGAVLGVGGDSVRFIADDDAGTLGTSPAFAIASGHVLRMHITYEV